MAILYENSASMDADRLKHILIADKHFDPQRLKQVIKSDIFAVLRDYMELESDKLFIDIELNSNGEYHLKVDAIANRLKIFGSLPDEY